MEGARRDRPGGRDPLQLMITTNDRQPLESGNELIAISGRVINPTDQEQKVPPIQAELRDKQTRAVVHAGRSPAGPGARAAQQRQLQQRRAGYPGGRRPADPHARRLIL